MAGEPTKPQFIIKDIPGAGVHGRLHAQDNPHDPHDDHNSGDSPDAQRKRHNGMESGSALYASVGGLSRDAKTIREEEEKKQRQYNDMLAAIDGWEEALDFVEAAIYEAVEAQRAVSDTIGAIRNEITQTGLSVVTVHDVEDLKTQLKQDGVDITGNRVIFGDAKTEKYYVQNQDGSATELSQEASRKVSEHLAKPENANARTGSDPTIGEAAGRLDDKFRENEARVQAIGRQAQDRNAIADKLKQAQPQQGPASTPTGISRGATADPATTPITAFTPQIFSRVPPQQQGISTNIPADVQVVRNQWPPGVVADSVDFAETSQNAKLNLPGAFATATANTPQPDPNSAAPAQQLAVTGSAPALRSNGMTGA